MRASIFLLCCLFVVCLSEKKGESIALGTSTNLFKENTVSWALGTCLKGVCITNKTLLEEHKKRAEPYKPLVRPFWNAVYELEKQPPKKATHGIILSSRHPAPQKQRFAEVILQWPLPIVTEWNRWLLWTADSKVNDTISIPLQWDTLPPSAWDELLKMCAESEEFACRYDTPTQKENRIELYKQMQREVMKLECDKVSVLNFAFPFTAPTERIKALAYVCFEMQRYGYLYTKTVDTEAVYKELTSIPEETHRGKYTVEIIKLE